MADNTLGFGISALGLENRQYAANDELLVDRHDGKMYYKRSDGIILSEIKDYTRDDLASSLLLKYYTELDNIIGDFIVYHTINIPRTSYINNADQKSVSSPAFPLDPAHPYVFVRFKGTPSVNAVASYLNAIYTQNHPNDDSKDITVSLEYTVSGRSNIIAANIDFNELTMLNLVANASAIKIRNFVFNKLAMAFNELTTAQQNNIKLLDYNNASHIAGRIDLITVTKSISSIPIYSSNSSVGDFVVLKDVFKHTDSD